jgi:hypothetical protein
LVAHVLVAITEDRAAQPLASQIPLLASGA